MTSGDLNIDLREKKTEGITSVIISPELPNAFFGFSLRRLGVELEAGGLQHHPPPHQVVENPEAHQGVG